jgi:hypothetical protein
MVPTPTPEQIADSLRLVELGGDPRRLSQVCLAQADHYEGAGRERLLATAAALSWAAQLLEAVDGRETAENARAGG